MLSAEVEKKDAWPGKGQNSAFQRKSKAIKRQRPQSALKVQKGTTQTLGRDKRYGKNRTHKGQGKPAYTAVPGLERWTTQRVNSLSGGLKRDPPRIATT